MEKQNIIDKLKELGIDSTNCYSKKSFIHEGIVVVGCYDRELTNDFYFFNPFDNNIYKIPKGIQAIGIDTNTSKNLVPLSECIKIWPDEPYRELEDSHFNHMTLRQYACIHLKIPNSGLEWLDTLIKST